VADAEVVGPKGGEYIILILTIEEAAFIKALSGNVGGISHLRKQVSDPIYYALHEVVHYRADDELSTYDFWYDGHPINPTADNDFHARLLHEGEVLP
jgi:hypothetical protein